MSEQGNRRVLLLSVGYGQGHHAAAGALAEAYEARGWSPRVIDICAVTQPFLFGLTQRFYRFCVRRAPWLWGITYSLTDTANWAELVRMPFMKPLVRRLSEELAEWQPDLIICTYPLFAFMLDLLRERGVCEVPYVVVVTDAREISRPWMRASASLFIVPDEESRRMMLDRYGLPEAKVIAAGFPVRSCFKEGTRESEAALRVLYGVYRSTKDAIADIRAILGGFPQVELTVIAGERARRLQAVFAPEIQAGRLVVLDETREMAALMQHHQIYIGKAGAATMFECYSSGVPVIVNFALPGQELGNLELLLDDAAGYWVESTPHLVDTLCRLLSDGAAGLRTLQCNIRSACRAGGAVRIVNAIERALDR